ncbi:hypothetical protein FRC03_006893 [Tulasnella sp. 419]|nr:hypothetical protein FRC03_006893 [Tulasnella sp. 419]
MLFDRLKNVYFHSFVFTTFIHCNRWLPLALQMHQPTLGGLWPAPIGVDWFKDKVDFKSPDHDEIAAWCWRGLIWTWHLAKHHLSLLELLNRDGQEEGVQREVEQEIEARDVRLDLSAGSHPSGVSNVQHYIKEEVQGEESKNSHAEKTPEQSKEEELKRAKEDGKRIKQLLFDENAIEFVMDFILKTGMEKITKHDYLMGRYWIPVAEDYLITASKDPQCQQSHPISVVLKLLSEHRSQHTA